MRAAIIAVIVCTTVTAHANEPSVAEAMRLEAALDYDGALAVVERVIAQGGADQAQLATLHLFAGKLAAGLERNAVAEDHFARALALDPMSGFAEGTSPKIVERFEAARARSTPLDVRMQFKDNVITLERRADPLGLVVGVAVRITEHGGATSEERAPAALRVVLPASTKTRDFAVRALDRHGNTVWSELAAYVAKPVDTTPTERPLLARWELWAVTSGVLLTVGGVSAWQFTSAQDEWDRKQAAGMTDFTELQRIEDRGRTWGITATLSLALGGATAITAIVLATTYSAKPRPVMSASRDAVGLAIAGAF